MREGRLRRGVAALATAVYVAASCTSLAPPAPPSPSPSAPIRGGRIIQAIPGDVATLQPILTVAPGNDAIAGLLYDTTIRYDQQTGEIRPNLASWQVSADGRTFTWTIRETATWTDGRPIVAADWLTGLRAVARSKATIRKSNFEEIRGFTDYAAGRATDIEGVRLDPNDAKRWTVTLGRAFCPALFRTSGYIIPAHVFERYLGTAGEIDRASENGAPTVTSGPFRFKERRPGDQLILARNDQYWKGSPLLDEYVLKVVTDPNLVADQLRTGELNLASIDAVQLEDIRKRPELRVHAYPALRYEYLAWDTRSRTSPALGDARVRRALAHALDVDTFMRTQLPGAAERVYAHHPPVSWAAPTGPLERYAYEPETAERLLREAGYSRGEDGVYAKGGSRLELRIAASTSSKVHQALVQVAVEQFKAVGVAAMARLEAAPAFITKIQSGTQDFDGWTAMYQLGPDPDPFLFWTRDQIPDAATQRRGLNWSGFADPQIDSAIAAARTPVDGDCTISTRQRHYETVNRILNRDVPVLFLWTPYELRVTSSSLQGYSPGPYSIWLWDVERWWFAR